MSAINRAMVGLATEMRQLNLFVIIVLPTFFDLDRYFAIWRTDTLFHLYFDKKGKRGRYIMFPFTKKKKLYILGKKMYNYNTVKSPYPACRFNKGYVVDEMKYRMKKEQAFRVEKLGKRETMYRDRIFKLVKCLRKDDFVKQHKIAEMMGVTPDSLSHFMLDAERANPDH
jgi:hypothetical protein